VGGLGEGELIGFEGGGTTTFRGRGSSGSFKKNVSMKEKENIVDSPRQEATPNPERGPENDVRLKGGRWGLLYTNRAKRGKAGEIPRGQAPKSVEGSCPLHKKEGPKWGLHGRRGARI